MRSQLLIIAGKSQFGVYLAQKFGGWIFGQMATDKAGIKIEYFAGAVSLS